MILVNLSITNRFIAVPYKKRVNAISFFKVRKFVISERSCFCFFAGFGTAAQMHRQFYRISWGACVNGCYFEDTILCFSCRGRRVVRHSEVPNPLDGERERELERTVKGSPSGGTPARKICSHDLEARM